MIYKKSTWKDFKDGDTIVTRWLYDNDYPEESLLFVIKTSPSGGAMGDDRFYAEYFFSIHESRGTVRTSSMRKDLGLLPTLFFYKDQNELLYILKESTTKESTNEE